MKLNVKKNRIIFLMLVVLCIMTMFVNPVSLFASNAEELSQKIWDRTDYILDNGIPAVNCFRGGSDDCLLH